MKKGKILALALAAGITFMGAGYAAWTDTVQIHTTVESGYLDVDFHECTIIEQSDLMGATITGMGYDDYDSRNDEDQEENEKGKDKVSVNISNAYPGATAIFEFKLEEDRVNGKQSIAAQLDNIQFDNVSEGWSDSTIKVEVLKGESARFDKTINGVADANPIDTSNSRIRVGEDCKIKLTVTFGNNISEKENLSFNIKAGFGQFYGNIPVATDAEVK